MLSKNLKKFNKPSNILIVGFGNVAYNIDNDKRLIKFSHFQALKDLNLIKNVKAICDINIDKIKFPKNLRKVAKFSNLNDLKKKFISFDLVIVLVPTLNYVKTVKKLIQNFNFKYLMIEKPITTSLKEFDVLNKLLFEKKIIFTINYQRNWDKNINKIKSFIDQNKPYLINIETSSAIIQSGSHFIELILKLYPNIQPMTYVDTISNHRLINNKKDPNGVMVLGDKHNIIIMSFLSSSRNYFKSKMIFKSDKKYMIYDEVKGVMSIGNVKFDSLRVGKKCEYDSLPNKIIKLKNDNLLYKSYIELLNLKKTDIFSIRRARRVIEIFSIFNIKY